MDYAAESTWFLIKMTYLKKIGFRAPATYFKLNMVGPYTISYIIELLKQVLGVLGFLCKVECYVV